MKQYSTEVMKWFQLQEGGFSPDTFARVIIYFRVEEGKGWGGWMSIWLDVAGM